MNRRFTDNRDLRILVLCADIGEGHVTVAQSLVEDLSARDDVEAVQLHTGSGVMGARLGRFLTQGFHTHLDEIGWSYELAYRIFFKLSPPMAPAVVTAIGRAIGLDLHLDFCEIAVCEEGEVRSAGRVASTPEALKESVESS